MKEIFNIDIPKVINKNPEIKIKEQILTPEQVKSKSRSPFMELEVVKKSATPNIDEKTTIQNFEVKKLLREIMSSATYREKISLLNLPPKNDKYNSLENDECVSNLKDIFINRPENIVEKLTRSSYSKFLEPYDLIKDMSTIEALKRYSKAYRSTEIMTGNENYAREYIIQNNSELGEVLKDINVKYSDPNNSNFSIWRNESRNYTILLSPKDINYSPKESENNNKMLDRIKVAHELYHAIFDELVLHVDTKSMHGEIEWDNSFFTLTEGFATIMELHLNKDMRDFPFKYGLNESDIQELEKLQNKRLKYLSDRVKSGEYLQYWEGVQGVFHNLLKEKGVSGVINFLKKIDIEKIKSLNVKDPNYINLIKEKDYNKWLEYLQKVEQS